MNHVLEKTALSETTRAFATPIVGGVAAAGVAYGLPAAIDKIREVRVRRNRDEYINEMKKVFPELKDIPKKDLHVAYNSIAMHSPHVLRDPLLGGQTLRSMANYRQADVNALNEINKLRGNNMMDQAILNATNAVSSGVSEGFKGYHAQRQADADQAYREKMDNYRMKMDQQKMQLEKKKMRVQQDQFNRSYGQRRSQFNRSFHQKEDIAEAQLRQKDRHQTQNFGQREDHFNASYNQRENDAAYRADRDAREDAKWQVANARQERMQALEEAKFITGPANRELIQAMDQGVVMRDADNNILYTVRGGTRNQAEARVSANLTEPLGSSYHTPPVLPEMRSLKRRKRKVLPGNSQGGERMDKQSSAADLYDIVSRLRDRNL